MVQESVRECDVYVISPGSGLVNDHLMELLIMISACKTASAKKVTAVLPVFPYSRQPDYPHSKMGAPSSSSNASAKAILDVSGFSLRDDLLQKTSVHTEEGTKPAAMRVWSDESPHRPTNYREWVAQAGTLVADLLTCAGADHIITMDLHDPQFQGFFDIPVDNLLGRPLLQKYITLSIPEYRNAVVVSPDAGGAKRATAIADALGMDFALIHKERRDTHSRHTASGDGDGNNSMILVGDVEGKVAILIDDLVDTAATITRAANMLKESGAVQVQALVTHALLSGDAIERINASALDRLVVTNSAPQDVNCQRSSKLLVLDVAPVFAEAIRRIHNGESVSMLFGI